MEKPAGVDPVGIRTVLVAARQAAAAGLTIMTGNQRRNQGDYWEAYMQINNGSIGEVVSVTALWNQGAWWNKKKRPEWSEVIASFNILARTNIANPVIFIQMQMKPGLNQQIIILKVGSQ